MSGPAGSPALMALLARAASEARDLGDAVALPSHALLAFARTPEPTAATVLRLAGLERARLATALLDAIKALSPGRPPRSDSPDLWQEIEAMGRKVAAAARIAASKDPRFDVLHLVDAILRKCDPIIEHAFLCLPVPLHRLVEAVQARIAVADLDGDRVPGGPAARDATPTLDQFARDLTALAAQGKLGPIVGRNREIRRVARTLLRKQKSNPMLLGEAGVGKSSVVEGLALTCASPNAPAGLRGLRLMELSLTSLLAGARYRGDFEERVQKVLTEAKSTPDVVLFLDDFQAALGPGRGDGSAQEGGSILKAPLGRGEIRCIGATTQEAWGRIEDADPALARRFMPIPVEEPSRDEAMQILHALKASYERHHGIRISEGAVAAAVDLSIRYLPDRRLPDKARDVIDQACSNLRLGTVSGRSTTSAPQPTCVEAEHVAQVLSDWTGIPVGEAPESEAMDLSKLEEQLRGAVFGQDEAIGAVASAIRKSRAGLGRPNRPIGVFLFLGPTGVGKTELARSLAAALFGSRDGMVRIDMSELAEEHSVAKLIGAPPGYVGHGSGGVLTEAVRKKPYSVILIDELEKANEGVFDLFLQIFDDARLTDGKGVTVDFRNTIIIMTSNVRLDPSAGQELGFGAGRRGGRLRSAAVQTRQGLSKLFRPEFVNRIDEVVHFHPLGPTEIRRIIDKLLASVEGNLRGKAIQLRVEPEVYESLMSEGFDETFGAREMERVVDRRVVRPIADLLVGGRLVAGDVIQLIAPEGEIKLVAGGRR